MSERIERITKNNIEFKKPEPHPAQHSNSVRYGDNRFLSKLCNADMFSSYEDAFEFYKNNYPIQTRQVLVEKYPKSTGQLLKFWEEGYQYNQGRQNNVDAETLLEQRRERLSKMLQRPVTGIKPTSEDYKIWDVNDKDFTSIYELF